MRDRPRKVYFEQDTPITTTIRIKSGTRKMLPKDQNLSEIVEMTIKRLFGNKEESAIEQQRTKVKMMEIELAKEKIILSEMEAIAENNEKIRSALRIEERYPATAFAHMIKLLRRAKPTANSISIDADTILRRWGIELNLEKLNREFEEGLLTNEEVVRKYSIKKIFSSSGAYWDNDIRKTIETEVGLR